MMKLKVKKLNGIAVVPKYATDGSGAMDLTAVSYNRIDHEHLKYNFGLAFEIPKGYVGLLFPRSSCYKQKQILSNCVGVIDSDYRGELSAIMLGNSIHSYKTLDRVAQIMIIQVPQIEIEVVDELSDTVRGVGGYGSTGR